MTDTDQASLRLPPYCEHYRLNEVDGIVAKSLIACRKLTTVASSFLTSYGAPIGPAEG
jgi:hypothetical protein